MTATDTLDDLEHTIARTLHAKADQLEVDDLPPIVDTRPPAAVIHLTPPRPSRRRILVAAAVVALVLAGVGVASRVDGGGSGLVATAGATSRYGPPATGVAGLVPDVVPAGWALAELDVGTEVRFDTPYRWQVFGVGDGLPLDRGVLVGTSPHNSRVIEDASHTVHGVPVWVGPPGDPSLPADAVTAAWVDGDVSHDAIAVGLGEDELVAFLGTLVSEGDPLDGFAGAEPTMPEVAAATVGSARTTSLTYVGPAGPVDTVRLTATSGDVYGGLVHLLDGTPADGGPVRRGALHGDPMLRFVAQTRDDGWSVEVLSTGSATVAEDPAVLDRFLVTLRPAAHDDLVALALAQPTSGSFPLADGRAVELHGTGGEDVGLCLVRESAPPACGTAEAIPGDRLVSASLEVDGRWILVTLGDAADPPTVEVDGDPVESAESAEFPARAVPDGRIVVSVRALPSDAGEVEVLIPTGRGTAAGFVYANPQG